MGVTLTVGKLVIIANPYPWVNQRGGASSEDMEVLLENLRGLGADEIHWEVIRNHALYPTEVGEILPASTDWPGDAPMSTFAHEVDPFGGDVVPLICMNRHYHGDVRTFLQTAWAADRWHLLASTVEGKRLGNGHIMDHLWAEVESHSIALLKEVRSRSTGLVHLDFTRGTSLVGFGPPLRKAWAALMGGEHDLDVLIEVANGAANEEGSPFTPWDELPDGVAELRCRLSQRLVERMLAGAGLEAKDVHIRALLRESAWMRTQYGFDLESWIDSSLASTFSFHNEWVHGEDCEWWSLQPLSALVNRCHGRRLQCLASVDWHGTGLLRKRPVPDETEPHHVASSLPPRTPDPDLVALHRWATEAVAAGVDGLMLYDGHLGLGGEGLATICADIKALFD